MNRETLIHIMQTERYMLDVAPRKNRIYMRLLNNGQGFPGPSQFLRKLHGVKYHLSGGFTMLMELYPQVDKPRHEFPLIRDIVGLLFEGGGRKIAIVFPNRSTRQEHFNEERERSSQGIQHKCFTSREAAEVWLDTPKEIYVGNDSILSRIKLKSCIF